MRMRAMERREGGQDVNIFVCHLERCEPKQARRAFSVLNATLPTWRRGWVHFLPYGSPEHPMTPYARSILKIWASPLSST